MVKGVKEMDVNRMTERLQTGILAVQTLAAREQHQEIDEVHLYLALIREEGNLIQSIIEKLEVKQTSS